jgi:hypothetical protein
MKIKNDYDSIIFDECESGLNHFKSKIIEQTSEMIFDKLNMLCTKSKKMILLDGDLNDRSKTFILNYDKNPYYLVNTIKKDLRHFKFYNNQKKYNNEIDKCVKEGKNICIVSMSETLCNYYYELYKDKYAVIKYTSKTSDKEKRELCDVSNIWTKVQILIYTPCIESGVDFNIPHFYKIFCVLSSFSTSQRGLNQMLHRVRTIENKNIECLLYNIPANEKINEDTIINFDDAKKFYVKKGNEYNHNEFSLFDLIYIYNNVESINKKPSLFLPIFIKMITNKGHTYEFVDTTKQKKEKNESVVLSKIVEQELISFDVFQELLKRQSSMDLNEQDKYRLTKYMYYSVFGVNFVSVEELQPYYNKLNIIKTYLHLCNNKLFDDCYTLQQIDNDNYFNVVRNIFNKINLSYEQLVNKNIVINRNEFINEENLKYINSLIEENYITFGENNKNIITSENELINKLKNISNSFGFEMVNIDLSKKAKNAKYMFKMDTLIRNSIYMKNQNDINKICV